jgi:hypothetical protein
LTAIFEKKPGVCCFPRKAKKAEQGETMNPEPSELIIGDTITWIRRSVQAISENDNGTVETIDIKASEGWALKFTAVGPDGIAAINAAADPDNADDFKFTANATTTAAYKEGDYQWQITATKSPDRYTIATGIITFKDNIAVRSALYDNRSHAKKVLDAIEAVIEGRASQDQMGYTIAGRSLSRTPLPDLLKLRATYKTEYDNELATANIAAGLGTGRKVYTRFI